MEIKSLKELDKLMKVARKNGVTTVKLPGIEFTIDQGIIDSDAQALKAKIPASPEQYGEVGADDKITSDGPSLTDLLFYSASGQDVPNGEA